MSLLLAGAGGPQTFVYAGVIACSSGVAATTAIAPVTRFLFSTATNDLVFGHNSLTPGNPSTGTVDILVPGGESSAVAFITRQNYPGHANWRSGNAIRAKFRIVIDRTVEYVISAAHYNAAGTELEAIALVVGAWDAGTIDVDISAPVTWVQPIAATDRIAIKIDISAIDFATNVSIRCNGADDFADFPFVLIGNQVDQRIPASSSVSANVSKTKAPAVAIAAQSGIPAGLSRTKVPDATIPGTAGIQATTSYVPGFAVFTYAGSVAAASAIASAWSRTIVPGATVPATVAIAGELARTRVYAGELAGSGGIEAATSVEVDIPGRSHGWRDDLALLPQRPSRIRVRTLQTFRTYFARVHTKSPALAADVAFLPVPPPLRVVRPSPAPAPPAAPLVVYQAVAGVVGAEYGLTAEYSRVDYVAERVRLDEEELEAWL